ncbi:S8 family serine peptidase [Massilia sp. R2A-15]|uniref:S8 family serine peptidase n=1 Tax=Massilia sp. R2A-15 TaxID=3064278 RepID=UPI002734DA36|nr:S8 family serine peptidase [Massilia sp. R2A-15]WLI91825.1 S8 family serine peptidase [Massilia sp. R2A-15]
MLALAAASAGAQAQLRLPSVGLPQLPRIGGLDSDRLTAPLRELPDVRALRLEEVGRLLRRHRDVLEADPRGEPAVRHEIFAWSPSPAALAGAAAEGLRVVRDSGDDALRTVVLRVPDRADTAAVLARLRALDPDGVYDFNHIYTGSSAEPLKMGSGPQDQTPMLHAPATKTGPGPQDQTPMLHAAATKAGVELGFSEAKLRSCGTVEPCKARLLPGPADLTPSVRVGLVDSGVETSHDVFGGARIARWGCGGAAHPSAHGTAVAALMVGRSARFHGVAPQASLFAADIYCDSPTGGSADQIAGALAWLAKQQVGVINLSLVGPANQALERVVGAMQQRGHLIVAAVGNDGPAAPPLYPASYPGVVGVSAVDRNNRPLPEAARGPQVMFAAPGNNMVSAAPGSPAYRAVRGTSFAAPLVAALLAESLAAPDKARAAQAVAALAKQALRPDGSTVSNETGYGIVGTAFRIDPSSLR